MFIQFHSATRGYTLSLERDLFGALVLFRRWWGLTNRRCGARRDFFATEEAAMKFIEMIRRRRASHGYVEIHADEKPIARRQTIATAALQTAAAVDIDLAERARDTVFEVVHSLGGQADNIEVPVLSEPSRPRRVAQ